MHDEAQTPPGRKTVLLVEDEYETRRLTYHALKHQCRVLEAADAEAAIALLEREPVDLVLLDLHLPPEPDSPRQGQRVQRRIAGLTRPVTVVVVSGDDDPGVRKAALRDGAREFLVKPLDVGLLARRVKELLAEGVR